MHAGLSSQLGHAICLLLEYTETSYEEKRYAMGDGEVKARVLEGPPRPAEALLRVPGIVAMFAGNKVQRVRRRSPLQISLSMTSLISTRCLSPSAWMPS
ncbi:uncharacterized protein LOC114612315 isoform X2 [Grammomys surdaster]|uniref:uncharacterized protein LOC114612315 isoform X2 n=1 Tax=Grammomys surdaster TaxID=491861 RepID=UPI00109FE251|nr:uncharacterized protein LOC114612315 isoform X2 [Grammomys surdaster]